MSRPNSSVPKGWTGLGGKKRSVMASLTGSYGVRWGPTTAANISPTMMSNPISVVRTVTIWRNVVRRTPRCDRTAARSGGVRAGATRATAESVADTGIDHDAGNIGQQIDAKVDQRRNEHRPLRDRQITIADGLDGELTHARIGKDIFEDEDATQEG